MRVLIVGCGYVGLPLGAELARHGHQVFGLRRRTRTDAELKAAGMQPLTGDITQPEKLTALPSPFDWVVNCVASGGGSEAEYRRLYLQGTRNLIEWLAPCPPKKFVYTGSTSVYGQNDGSLVDEASPTEPPAETARVLVETEKIIQDAVRSKGFPGIILRLAGIYGPGRGHWFKQYLKNEARLEDDGGRILNMIHRDDVIGCVIQALEKGQGGEIYNAVDDEPVSQLDFFKWLAETLGRPLPPSSPADPNRRRGISNKRISNRKIKRDLQYRFKYPDFRHGYREELRRLNMDNP